MQIQTEFSLHIPHIMWQPAFTCNPKCNGCYVAAAPKSILQQGPSGQLLKALFRDRTLSCNTLTISLGRSGRDQHRTAELLLETLLRVRQQLQSGRDGPNIALSFRDATSASEWFTAIDTCSPQVLHLLDLTFRECLHAVDGIVLSEPLAKKQIRKLGPWGKTHYRYNHLARGNEMVWSKKIGHLLDHLYCIMYKAPLGQEQDYRNFAAAVAQWRTFHTLLGSTTTLDQCITASDRYVRSEGRLMCNACIDKIHIWPDNSVTGCPYDARQVVARAERRYDEKPSTKILMQEIAHVVSHRKKHPMQFCKIPAMIREHHKRHKSIL
jgi:hypothetical protein